MNKNVVLCCGASCSAVLSVFSLVAVFYWVQVTAGASAGSQATAAQQNVYLWFGAFIAGVVATCALVIFLLRPILLEIITEEVCEENQISRASLGASDSVF